MVLVEAFATATPVVASNIPGFADVAVPGRGDARAAGRRGRARRGGGRPARRRGAPRRDGPGGRAPSREERYAWPDIARRLEDDLRAGPGMKGGRWRLLVPVVLFAVAISLIWWRGPDWHLVRDTFALGRAGRGSSSRSRSTCSRSSSAPLAWNTVIREAVDGAAARVPARLLGVLRRAVRERRAAGAGRASSAASPCSRGGCRGARGSWRRSSAPSSRTGCSTCFPTTVLVDLGAELRATCRTGR